MLYLELKDKFFNTFETWFSKIEKKLFGIDQRKKFIFIKLKNFYKKKSIILNYIILYIYKKMV